MLEAILATACPGLLLFSESTFSVLIYGALGGSALGLLTLLFLILRDRKKGEIW